MMSQVGRVREVVCAYIQCVSAIRDVEDPVFVCLRCSSSRVTEVGEPYKVRETRAEGCHAK